MTALQPKKTYILTRVSCLCATLFETPGIYHNVLKICQMSNTYSWFFDNFFVKFCHPRYNSFILLAKKVSVKG